LRSHQHGHDDDKNLERFADDGEKLFVEGPVRFDGGALLPNAHQQVDQFEDGIRNGAGHDDFQALVQDVVNECSPVENLQPDFQEDDEHDNLDRPAEQADQQIVEFGLGALGPLFQPHARQGVEQFGNAKRQEDVNERGEVLPQRNS